VHPEQDCAYSLNLLKRFKALHPATLGESNIPQVLRALAKTSNWLGWIKPHPAWPF
jgi:hypothetical protein